MNKIAATFIFFALLLPATAGRASDVSIVAGPMVGHVTDNSARVWMQFSVAGEVGITVYDVQRNQMVSGLKTDLEGPSPFVCDVPLSNLQADRSYRIEVKFEGMPVTLPGPSLVVRTAPLPGDEAVFSVGFGSDLAFRPSGRGNAAGGAASIFKAISELKPRAFLFLGNTGYLPAKLENFPTTRRLAFRYICDMHDAIRREPALQSLFRTTPCYSIYNDRDFGTAGADSSFTFGPESLVAFQRFWPNPDWGTPDSPGCFSKFTFGDADFFLLDIREFRTPATSPATTEPAATMPQVAMLGSAQLNWLEKSLKESHATFKILAAPCALFNAEGDSWMKFPDEEREFVKWLKDNQVTGVLALSGNLPAGEILKADPQETRYPLFTAGTSTLTDIPRELSPEALSLNPAVSRAGDIIMQNNFGTLDFGGEHEHRFVTLRIHDEAGKTRAEQTLFAVQLRN